MTDKVLIQSYVFHGEDCFYVNTFDRDSSAPGGPRRFAETLVYRFDQETQTRTELVGQFSTLAGLVYKHFAVCRALFDAGRQGLEGIYD